MQIATTRRAAPQRLRAKPMAAPKQAAQTLTDDFTFSAQQQSRAGTIVKTVGALAVGVSLGAWAGMNSGMLAGLGGAAVTVIPGAFAGGISGALIAERVGQSDPSRTAGAGLWGAVIGGAVGAAGGAFLGSQVSGLGAAVGLAVVGGTTSLLVPK